MRQVDLDLASRERQRKTEGLVVLDGPKQKEVVQAIAGAIVAVIRTIREREVSDECAVER